MESIQAHYAEGESAKEVDLRRAFGVLRRRWWIVVVCAILAPAAAFAFSATRQKQYTATASIVFNSASVAQQASGVATAVNTDPQGQRSTNLALVQLSNVVSQRTAHAIGLGLTPSQVRSAVSASAPTGSNIVSVSATSPYPPLAARIANAFANAFIAEERQKDQATIEDAIRLVQQQYNALSPSDRRTSQGQSLTDHIESLQILRAMQTNTQLAQAATVPTSPSSPAVTRNTAIGVVLGILLGIGLAFLADRLDRRLRDPSEVAESLGLPMLGLIPHAPLGAGPSKKSAKVDAEPFRMLRANLRYFNVDREMQTLLVSSARPSEGKTTVARRLAGAAASMGTSTLLVEADLRRPTFSREFALEPSIGLAGALVSTEPFERSIQSIEVESQGNGSVAGRQLDVIPAGSAPPNPAELLESNAMQQLLVWAKEHYEFIVIDTPPLSAVADAIPLMTRVDGIVVVSRLGLSTRDGAEHLRSRLAALGAPLLGVVVNDMRSRSNSYRTYGYDYNFEYEPDKASEAKAPVTRADVALPPTPETSRPRPVSNGAAPSSTGTPSGSPEDGHDARSHRTTYDTRQPQRLQEWMKAARSKLEDQLKDP
jgi:capsular exopolysaccharide synthesis family protein